MSPQSLVSGDRLYALWENFIEDDSPAEAGVREEVAASWIRSRQYGVEPRTTNRVENRSKTNLDTIIKQYGDLIETARDVIGRLITVLPQQELVIALANQHGLILETRGCGEIREKAVKIGFSPGYYWSEKIIGTNAIGTCLVTRKPCEIIGSEHYSELYHRWVTSACPIIKNSGEVVGVLGLLVPIKQHSGYTLGVVSTTARLIADQMDLRRAKRELALSNNRLATTFDVIPDGIIIVDKNAMISEMNPAAQQLFDTPLQGSFVEDVLGVLGTEVRRMLQEAQGFSNLEVVISPDRHPIHCLAMARPIQDDKNQLAGGIILLRPLERVQHQVNQFRGAHATYRLCDILGDSPEMMHTKRMADLAASGSATVLLEGESGTGKEIFAQAIHNGSQRSDGPFVAVNCGAIPRDLLGSELFGYIDGAFTGARRGGRMGKFEMASGGTLFLDEIGDMPLDQQVALLRVLQEKQVTRLGSNKVIPVDVRIICATNKDLAAEVARGNFRQDLYYRINVFHIRIPPLREHREDIPVLFYHFLNQLSTEQHLRIEYVDPEVITRLTEYKWPGNIRELQNVVERMVNIIEENRVCVYHLPEEIMEYKQPNSYSKNNLWQTLREQEKQKLLKTLTKNNGNISVTARELGMSRTTLYRKLGQYGLSKE